MFRAVTSRLNTSVFARNMSTREIVHTDAAPAAIGPYSQANKFGNMLFVSGQLGIDAKTGEFASSEVEGQATMCLENLKSIVEAGGSSMDKVCKTTVLLADMNDFAKVNAIYSQYFDGERAPARACFAVKTLPKNALVEIDAYAALE